MVRLISRQRGGLAALKLTKLFGIDDFPAAKDAGKVLIIIIYCYLIIRLCPTKICELFHMHCSPYNLRVSAFAIPRFTTMTYGKHSLTYLGPKLWNGLPGEIRSQPSLGSFKHRICIKLKSLIVEDNNV